MSEAKTWRRVTLGLEHSYGLSDVRDRIGEAAGFPPNWPADLNIFIKQHRINEMSIPAVLYFPPSAVGLCADIIADYPSEACGRPAASDVAVWIGPGSVDWE